MTQRFSYGPWLAAAALVGSGVLVWSFYPREADAPAPAPQPAATVDVPVAVKPPETRYPIEQVPVLPEERAEPLPPLDDSDTSAMGAIATLLGGTDPRQFLQAQFLLPRLVATIDNLPRKSLTQQIYAGRPVSGNLGVAEADGRLWLDPAARSRYDVAVRAFEALDAGQAVSAYVRFYPLLQQAYRDLGQPDRQFNDRLVEVIDHLLAAPTRERAIELVPVAGSPRMAFADPRLEDASVGHKAMLRLGPDHAERVKVKLRELRGLLAGKRPQA